MSPQSTVRSPQSTVQSSQSCAVSRGGYRGSESITHHASRITHPPSRSALRRGKSRSTRLRQGFHLRQGYGGRDGGQDGGQAHNAFSGFTLIEMMVVVGIMAIVMCMGVPIVYRVFHKDSLNKAVTDVVEVCSHARARAILQGHMTEVVFHPKERRLEVAGAGGGGSSATESGAVVAATATVPSGSGLSSQIPENLAIMDLDINLTPYVYKDQVFAEEARVRFYPNGTCDEMYLILRSDKGEERGVVTEVTTGLASVLNEAELQRLRDGKL